MEITSFLLGYKAGAAKGGGSSADVRYVTFLSHDGSIEYGKKPVAVGDDCADPIARGLFDTPTRESTAQYDFSFVGWATAPDGAWDETALDAVTEDRTVYAAYASVLRYYTITYYDSDGATVLTTQQVAYGSVPSYTPEKSGYDFTGWIPEAVEVTGDAAYTAQWAEKARFETATWAEIAEICNSGKAAEYFAIGDTRTVGLKNHVSTVYPTETVTFEIVAINTDDKEDGTKAGITVVSKYSVWNPFMGLSSSVEWGIRGTGWANSTLREKLNGTVFDSLPSDLQAVITPVVKKSSNSNATAIETTVDKLWITSYTEHGLSPSNSISGQGYSYPGCNTAATRKAYRLAYGVLSDSYENYGVRSALTISTNQGTVSGTTGGATESRPTYARLGFCI